MTGRPAVRPPAPRRAAPIVVVPYDPAWPARFAEARDAIAAACGARVVAIEHVGSTSVVGLAAKPTIDLAVATRTLADADACVPALEALGYRYDRTWEHELPRRRYFQRKDASGAHTHHVHVVPAGDGFFEDQVAFRDALRADPELARAYAALKVELAARFRDDREAYTDAKGPFVREVLARARPHAP